MLLVANKSDAPLSERQVSYAAKEEGRDSSPGLRDKSYPLNLLAADWYIQ